MVKKRCLRIKSSLQLLVWHDRLPYITFVMNILFLSALLNTQATTTTITSQHNTPIFIVPSLLPISELVWFTFEPFILTTKKTIFVYIFAIFQPSVCYFFSSVLYSRKSHWKMLQILGLMLGPCSGKNVISILEASLSSSLLNIICYQIWYQSKSDSMDRA